MVQEGGGRIDGRIESLVNDKSIQTLLLDLLQRTAVLETSTRLSDGQRTELISTITRLGDRLGEVTGAIKTLSRLDEDVQALNERLDKHDELFAEARGGLRVARVFWSVVWGTVGGLIGLIVAWLKSGSHQ